jgi:rubrerythrin
MNEMTEQHLINAFGGESMANMRYRLFGTQARKEHFPNVGRLFDAIAHAEYIHAGDHYRELEHLQGGFVANSKGTFGPEETAKNLQLAIDGEDFEITQMYPVYMEVAQFQGEHSAYRSFNWSYQTEKQHRDLFQRAKSAVDAGNDLDLGPVQICEVCGYTLEGDAPDNCPVCSATKDQFRTYE